MNADIHTAYQGCPGTGKTTTLMDVLADEIESGTGVEDIAASTFRRSMAAEFKERAAEKVEIPDQNYFGTTHSLCYHLIGTPEVISETQKAEFCERLGLTYTGPETGVESDVGSVVLDENIGNVMFSSREYCINAETDPDKAMREGNLDVSQRVAVDRAPVSGFEEFNAEYERFKDEQGVVDFHDMFLLVLDQGLVPNVDVLIEDEFQDKTPLQVSVFEMWADEIDRVYVAGDVFQSIQGWAAAKPEHMIEALEQADEAVTLDTSYRFGPELWDYATDILERAYRRSDIEIPDIEPVGESSVERLSFSEYRNEVKRRKAEESLHLLRAGYMSDSPASALKSAGVPFSSPRGARWTEKMIDAYNGIVRVTNAAAASGNDFGGVTVKVDLSGMSLEEAYRAAEALRASNLRGTKKSTVSTLEDALDEESDTGRGDLNMLKMFSPGDIADNMDGQNPFGSTLLTKATNGLDRMESAYNELDGALITEVNHEVRTIHAAKGKEAKNVYLFDGISPAVAEEHEGFSHRSKAEARVFFVGATRAIDNLFVVDYPDKPKFKLPGV